MLRLDHEVARIRKLKIQTIQTSMDQLDMLGASEFDLVIHPGQYLLLGRGRSGIPCRGPASCVPVGSISVSINNPSICRADLKPLPSLSGQTYSLRHAHDLKQALPVFEGESPWRETGTREFIHGWEALIGSMCRAGFLIEDLMEPQHGNAHAPVGSKGHRARFVAPYVRIKARLATQKSGSALLGVETDLDLLS